MKGAGLVRGDATNIPLADESVDVCVSSPPYFALRSYQDGGEHYGGQIGSEPTPTDFLCALWAVMDEAWRVLKPGGSAWINLGDKYAGSGGHNNAGVGGTGRGPSSYNKAADVRNKSLMGLPWRFALGLSCPELHRAPLEPAVCWHDDGPGACRTCKPRTFPQWVLRAEVVWSKPNGLPESVTDRVRRSHEQWFHLTKLPRYFAAVDEVREASATGDRVMFQSKRGQSRGMPPRGPSDLAPVVQANHPLGKLPGSVWTIASEPLKVPEHLGVDHFACLDEATEILTERGWLTHDQLSEGDTVAGYNLDLGRAEWTTCHAVHRYDHNGPLVAVEKRGLSMRLTPNHRVLAHKRKGRSGARGPMQVIRADELTAAHFILQSAEWESYERKAIGVDLAALLGWVAAEGWVTETGQVRLCQSVTANPEHVDTIDGILGRLDLPPADRSERTKYRSVLDVVKRTSTIREWRGRPSEVVTWALPLGLSQEITRLLPGKRLTWDLLGLPENERRALLDSFIDGDGHRRPDGRSAVYQKDRRNLDVLQAVAVTLGYRTRLTTEPTRYVLYLTTGDRSVTLRGTNGASDPIPTEHHTGTVWCPTTGTGTFVARRNGKVFITGNSFPQEWPRRIILGWSPSGICTACGEGRRPVVAKEYRTIHHQKTDNRSKSMRDSGEQGGGIGRLASERPHGVAATPATITGYACACPDTSAPTRPAVVLDPFAGTGTTVMTARALGRYGVGLDLSADYLRLASWRVFQSGHARKAEARTNQERQGALTFGGVA